jgi:iron(III) transport system ATP-binding protein
VVENVGFGLGGRSREWRQARVAELLERVNMTPVARAWPHTLSGGEQQRIALARALAPEPALMLLDEAFSALDATLRDAVRSDTLAVLRETGTPTLLVTHDADEAIRAGDRIHVMQAGRVIQSGAPAELYRRPASAFVAGFFGAVNRFAGVVEGGAVRLPIGLVAAAGLPEREIAEVIVRPEGVRLAPPVAPGRSAARQGVLASVVEERDLGPVSLLTLGLPDGSRVHVRRHDAVSHATGQEVEIDLDPNHVFVYPATA